MKKFHIYHIVSLLFAIAIGSATMAQQTEALLEFGNINIETLENGYSEITLEGCNSQNHNIGLPKIPTLQWIINSHKDAWIEIVEKDSVWIDLGDANPIMPTQPSRFKNGDTPAWQIAYGIYDKDSFYGLPLCELTPLGIMGSTEIARITVAPVRYNPQRNQLIVYNKLKYRIHGLAQQKIIPEDLYVAVIPNKYADIAQPLLQWRSQLGWNVKTIYTVSNKKDSIHNVLKEMYRHGEVPTYILLVGGINDIKAFSGHKAPSGIDNRLSDMFYGEYTNDGYPEAMVGRLAVNDSAELRIVIDKILDYEQNPDTIALMKSLIVAGEEDRHPAPITTNGQVNYVGERLASVVDTICFHNPESNQQRDSIISTLSNGVGLINYTSHCEYNKWNKPSLTVEDVDSLAPYAGIWINNCCSSNRIGGNSLGENLLKQTNGGGIGIIGATNESLWDEDYYWSIGAKRPYTLHPVYDSAHLGGIDYLLKKETLGEIIRSGNMAVTTVGSPYELYYWEIYSLYGDPATRPYLGVTPKLTSPITSSLNIGGSHVDITGMAGACVTVMQEGTVIGKCILDDSGHGNIDLSHPLSENEIILTTSKAWYRPQIDTIQPQPTQDAWIIAQLITEQNSIDWGEEVAIKIAYKNIGNTTVEHHQITLIQTHEDSIGAWIGAPISVQIYHLGPMETDTISGRLSLTKLNELTELRMHLTVSQNGEIYVEQPIVWEVNHTKLQGSLNITQEGLQIKKLMPHQQYSIQWKLENKNSYPIENIQSSIWVERYPNKAPLQQEESLSITALNDSTLQFNITTDDTLQGLWITAEAQYEGITITRSGWWIAGYAIEDFDNGTFEHYHWNNVSVNPWEIDSTVSHSGRYSLKSGAIDHQQRCDINIWVETLITDTLGFWYRTSSETNKDKLYFCMNNAERFFNSGVHDWTYWMMEIPAGQHKLTWRYYKNDSKSEGADAVWIDDIRFPMSRWKNICGNMDSIIYAPSVSIEIPTQPSTWKIWPNPAIEKFNIQCSQNGTVTLWDCMGRCIDEIKIENSKPTQYSTSQLRFGLYLLVYTTTEGTSTKKLMITPKK